MRFIDLQEGPNDPGIFKAIFLAGGPGSGKSYVASQLGLVSRGLKVVNSDDAFEYLMRKRNLSFDMPPEEQPWRDVARTRAKDITNKKQDLYLDGRLGLIIDGTAKDVTKMAKLKNELEAIGYQTLMLFVNTDLKTALQRNLLRQRKVPTEIVVASHKQVQENKLLLADVFSPNFVEVLNNENPDFNTPLKRVDKFLEAPITPQAKDWVSKAQLKKNVAAEGVIYQLDKAAPMDDTEVLVLGGAGRYSLAGLRDKARKEAGELAKDLDVNHGGAFRRSAQNVKQLSNTLNTIVAAYDELNDIRKQGGVKSKGIRNEDVEHKPKVYVDMDGVIANFYAGVTRVTGHAEPRELALQDMEDTMASFKDTDFFYQLPKYDQADQLIAMVNKMTNGDWYILSSPLKYDREGSAKWKAKWVRDKLKIQPRGMHFTGDKAQFATQADGTPNILIDDYPDYLKKWTNAGGIGVKYKGHVGNIEDVKATLEQHLSVDETIRKVKGGYRLVSKKGKNLGTYRSKLGAKKRERQVQYFKHMGEQGRSTAVEPDPKGYQHSALTAPQYTLVVDKSDDMDFYKLGQHYTSLANYDKHELGVGPSDMTITFASPEEMERMKGVFDKLGVKYKDISGSHEEPEIHTKESKRRLGEDVTQADLDQIELYADRLFSKVGIDINFTRHFVDRVNDERNKKPITPAELTRLFKQEFKRWGKPIAQMGPDAEAVMKDMQTDVNMPFILKWDNATQELDLIAKTIMRKPDFKSPDPMFTVEAADKCPPATQNIDLNLKNRQKAIERYGYGPLNPNEENNKFWSKKAQMWQLDTVDEAKKSVCGNCAAFDITKHTLDCIAKGIGNDEGSEDPFDVIEAGHLGYCRFLKFKCAAARTCDAWVVGGPLTDKKSESINEVADSPYEYVQNVKTPDKRAYRFQTEAGQLYRVQVFNRRGPKLNGGIYNKLEIHFDLTDMKTGKPNAGVTGTGDAVRVFSTVANILKQEVASQDPTGVIIASKADDESRVKLYRTLARRATKLMPDYEVAGEKQVTGASGDPYLTIELAKK